MEVQEDVICKYIYCFDKIYICARSKIIVGVANYIICFEIFTFRRSWLKFLFNILSDLFAKKALTR